MKSWDSAGLWAKAKHFSDIANENGQSSANFALYCSLSLECLARSVLTQIHPALNADPREDLNVLYAFGFELTAKPKSLPAHSVYIRVEKLVDGFQKQHRELCEFLALLRNAHLHTADLPFEKLAPNRWLPLRFPHELHADACVCASTSGGSVRSLSSHSPIRPIGHDRIKASRPMRMVE